MKTERFPISPLPRPPFASLRAVVAAFLAVGLLIAGAALRPAAAEDLQGYLDGYFGGSAIQFGYGSGTGSGSPRVELFVRYCASGNFVSSGRSCRPNLYASGYQCTSLQDAGRWRIVTQGGRGQLQWVTGSGNTGSVDLRVRGDGVVVDPRGNPFVRVRPAQC